MRFLFFCAVASACVTLTSGRAAPASLPIKPDLIVALDGSGNFRSIQEAVQSIPLTNHERQIIFVRDGVYHEKVRVDAPCITIIGQSREGTRLEFTQGSTEFGQHPDKLGRAPLNLSATANDFVLQNLTVKNTQGVIGVHAFAIYGLADRTVITDCDVLSQGNDTLSLWRGRAENQDVVAASMSEGDAAIWREGGRYYHARLNVTGSVDFICPRGWCYMVDSAITEVNPAATAGIWHDGSNNANKKFVLRNCRFDGPKDFYLGRHHHDAQFFLLDCTFSAAMRDQALYRVVYPLNGAPATEADLKRNQDLDRTNVYGERAYYYNSHRTGGDYAWHRDNLASAPGAPTPDKITAAWTFAGSWDPEKIAPPKIANARADTANVDVTFNEIVTVKGHPSLSWPGGKAARYVSGSGTKTLRFEAPPDDHARGFTIVLNAGAIVATEAGATLRLADLSLPLSP